MMCELRTQATMLGYDTLARQRAMRKDARRYGLSALHKGMTWAELQALCGIAKRTLTKEMAKAREENPDLAERLPRARSRGTEFPCGIDGCEATFDTPWALRLHQHRKGGHVQRQAS